MRRSLRLHALLLLLLPFSASAALFHVPGQFPTIQQAIDASAQGDTVLVADGIYAENLRITEHAITLASYYLIDGNADHIQETILIGGQDPEGVRLLLHVEAPLSEGMLITGFSFLRSPSIDNPFEGCVVWNRTVGMITNCHFEGFEEVGNAYLIQARSANNFALRDLSFHNNVNDCILIWFGEALVEGCSFTSNMNMLLKTGESNITMRGCYASQNRGRHGLVDINQIRNANIKVLIEDNTFIENEINDAYAGSVSLWSVYRATVYNNRFINNTVTSMGASGVAVMYSDHVTIHHNLFEGNDGLQYGATIQVMSNGLIHRNIFRNNRGRNYIVLDVLGESSISLYRNLFEDNHLHEVENPPYWSNMVQANPRVQLTIEECDFRGNIGGDRGILYFTSDNQTAVNNFWGHPSGPYQPTHNPEGEGEFILLSSVQFEPYSNEHFVLPNLRLAQDILTFANVAPGEVAVMELEIVNGGVLPLRMEEIVSDNPSFSAVAEFEELGEDERGIIRISFAPEEEGGYRATLRFLSNDPFTERDVVMVSGTSSYMSVGGEDGALPQVFHLSDAWPNPFNAETRFSVALPQSSTLTVKVFDLLGREVIRLHEGVLPAGHRHFAWQNVAASSGVYLLDARTSLGDHSVRKVVLVR